MARIGGLAVVWGGVGAPAAGCGRDVSPLGPVGARWAVWGGPGGAAGGPCAGRQALGAGLGGLVLAEPAGEWFGGAVLVGEDGDEGVDLVAGEVELESLAAGGVGAAVAEAFFEVAVLVGSASSRSP